MGPSTAGIREFVFDEFHVRIMVTAPERPESFLGARCPDILALRVPGDGRRRPIRIAIEHEVALAISPSLFACQLEGVFFQGIAPAGSRPA